MDGINGYPLDLLDKYYLSRMSTFTQSSFSEGLRRLDWRLEQNGDRPVYISLGENCGPSMKLKEASANTLGSNFFDNLVIRTPDICRLINCDFNEILMISNLEISLWEGNDSVYDKRHAMFFHHYFHLPGSAEKDRFLENGVRVRLIEEADIPLFLSGVSAQFAYLKQKFKNISRSPVKKHFVVRSVDGSPLSEDSLIALHRSLSDFGCVNFTIANVCVGKALQLENFSYVHVEELPGVRWGAVDDWKTGLGLT